MNEFWNKRAETMSQDEIRSHQISQMKWLLNHTYRNNKFYKKKMDNVGFVPDDFRSLEDLQYVPSIHKEDFREEYPLGMLCVDKNEIREMHMSSGSTGTPVVMAYNDHDLNQWAECMARCYTMAGLNTGDSVQITPSFGLFNGGFGFYHGARKRGLFAIPAGAGNTPKQITLLKDFKVKCLTGVVSYGIRIMEVMNSMYEDLPDLKIGIFGAETFSDSLRTKIQDGLGIEAFDIYGMTETGGVGTTGMDCKAHNGIHVWEDQYLCEILDPVTGKPVDDNTEGEVVFTSLNRQSIPIVRFKTGDLTKILSREKCSCGRTGLRLERVTGRKDDMLIVKGVNFFPKQVEEALMEIPGVCNNYQIIVEENHGVTDVKINVEALEYVTGFVVEKKLKERLGFSPKGDVFKPGELPRQEGKAIRVINKTNHK